MPRSDDWTIHMPPALIKLAAGTQRLRMLRPRSPRRGFASLCPASWIRLRISASRTAYRGFASDHIARFFFAGCDRDCKIPIRRESLFQQAFEIVVESTRPAPLRAHHLLPRNNRRGFFVVRGSPWRRRAWQDAKPCAMPSYGEPRPAVPCAR